MTKDASPEARRAELVREGRELGLSRREILKILGAGAALVSGARFFEPHAAFGQTSPDRGIRRLSYLSQRATTFEGTIAPRLIEGTLPASLNGELLRIGPGMRENFGTRYDHLFDGDAYLARLRFRDGTITGSAQFIATPERVAELAAGRMLYHEFGTAAPEGARGYKNQPSVNVVPWDGVLLALSEGGLPVAIDPADGRCLGAWDFRGSFPRNVSFTAHPKFDPVTGDGYAYGFVQGMSMGLRVFKLERTTGKAVVVTNIRLDGYYMVHDFVQTRDHLVLVVPPLSISILDILRGRAPLADYLHFDATKPARAFVVPKTGGTAHEFTLPTAMLFHHGNGFETGNELHFDSVLGDDGSGLPLLAAWGKDALPTPTNTNGSRLVRTRLDLARGTVLGQNAIANGMEFPRFDERYAGQNLKSLYSVGLGLDGDALAQPRLVRTELASGATTTTRAEAGIMYGEPVFAGTSQSSGEGSGFVIALGYDGSKDETFVDVLESSSLERVARAWLGSRIPLGFHGSFVPTSS